MSPKSSRFEIAAKYADLAYTFQQFGPSVYPFNALQESCNYGIGHLPRDRLQ
jgi:hypothetical protein